MKEEGYSRLPYKDSRGILSIGNGFNIQDVGLSEDECAVIVYMRLNKLQHELESQLKIYNFLDYVRQEILLDMAYNLGIEKLLKFKDMIRCLCAKDYLSASNAMKESLWYKEVGERAVALTEAMKTGSFI